MSAESFSALLSTHGLWLMAPLALVEGPLVTVAAGALAAQGLLPLVGVILTATLADLAGDALLWLAGRNLRHRLPRRWARRINRTIPLSDLRRNAGRVLVFGKLTHSLGALVLVAAGMARVPALPFLGFNLLATLPKATALALVGWAFGTALVGTDHSAAPLGVALFAIATVTALFWLRKKGLSHARLLPHPGP